MFASIFDQPSWSKIHKQLLRNPAKSVCFPFLLAEIVSVYASEILFQVEVTEHPQGGAPTTYTYNWSYEAPINDK